MTSKSKNRPFKRETAKKLLEKTIERVHEYNQNPFNPVMFTDMVLFGSYVNDPDKMMLGDLDIAFGLARRYTGDALKVCEDMAWNRIQEEFPSLSSMPIYADLFEQHAFKFLKQGSKYLSEHRWESNPEKGDMPYILSDTHVPLDVGEVARLPDEEMIAYAEAERDDN